MKPIVIFGAGDIAELAECIRTDSDRCRGGRRRLYQNTQFHGRPVVPFEEIQAFPPQTHDLFVALSYVQLNALRANKMAEAEAKGYSLASYISSHAYVWDGFAAGPNAFILEDNTLQPFCRVGRGVTLWSGNHIGHHSSIGDYCFLASHIVVSGGVTIGERCFAGVNVTSGPCQYRGAVCSGRWRGNIARCTGRSGLFCFLTERSKVPSSVTAAVMRWRKLAVFFALTARCHAS